MPNCKQLGSFSCTKCKIACDTYTVFFCQTLKVRRWTCTISNIEDKIVKKNK